MAAPLFSPQETTQLKAMKAQGLDAKTAIARVKSYRQLGGLIKNLPKTLPKIATKAAVKGTLAGVNKLANVSRTADKLSNEKDQRLINAGYGKLVAAKKSTLEERNQAFDEIKAKEDTAPSLIGNIQGQALHGFETAGRGVVDLVNAASALGQIPLRGIDALMGRKDYVAQVGDQGLYNVKGEKGNLIPLEKAWRGTSKAVLGTAEALGSPVGGAIQTGVENLPKPMQQGVAWLVKQPPDLVKNIAKSINPNLTDEQINENILNPLGALATVGGIGKLSKLKTVNKAEQAFAKSEKLARKLGFDPGDLSTIKNLSPELQAVAQKYLEAAQRKKMSPRFEEGSFATAGKEIESIITQADEILSSKGKNLGTMRKDVLSQKTIKTAQEQKNAYQDFLKNELNVKFKPKKGGGIDLDFADSRISGNAGAIDKFKDVFKLLKKKNLNARDVEARTGQINELTGLLKQSGFKDSEANTMLNQTKSIIDEAVGTVAPEFKGLKADYAGIAKELKRLKNAAKVGSGDLAIHSGEQVMRRYLGNAGKKYEKAISSAEKLAKKLGFEEGTNLRQKAALADMIEHYTETFNPQSLQGNLRKFSKFAVEKVPLVGKPLSALDDVIHSSLSTKKLNTVLSDLIKKAPQGKKGNVNISKLNKTGVALVLNQLMSNASRTTPQNSISGLPQR